MIAFFECTDHRRVVKMEFDGVRVPRGIVCARPQWMYWESAEWPTLPDRLLIAAEQIAREGGQHLTGGTVALIPWVRVFVSKGWAFEEGYDDREVPSIDFAVRLGPIGEVNPRVIVWAHGSRYWADHLNVIDVAARGGDPLAYVMACGSEENEEWRGAYLASLPEEAGIV